MRLICCKATLETEIHADQTYKGRFFLVTGRVSTIGRSVFSDNPYLTLNGDRLFSSVFCDFSQDAAHELAELVPGQFVKIAGVCDGESIGNDVHMSKCELKEKGPRQ